MRRFSFDVFVSVGKRGFDSDRSHEGLVVKTSQTFVCFPVNVDKEVDLFVPSLPGAVGRNCSRASRSHRSELLEDLLWARVFRVLVGLVPENPAS